MTGVQTCALPISLVLLGSVRELFSLGSIFDIQLLGSWHEPWVIMVLPAGAFITLGLLIGAFNLFKLKNKN